MDLKTKQAITNVRLGVGQAVNFLEKLRKQADAVLFKDVPELPDESEFDLIVCPGCKKEISVSTYTGIGSYWAKGDK